MKPSEDAWQPLGTVADRILRNVKPRPPENKPPVQPQKREVEHAN